MEKKIKVAVIFGGRSAEHEVSLQSAKNVIASLDKEKYEPVLIGINRDGRWFLNKNSIELLNANNPRLIQLNSSSSEVVLTPNGSNSKLIGLNNHDTISDIDVIFPVLHGPYGEDGSVQGLAKLANLPCVGAGIAGSAVGMDKDIMKRLLRDAGIKIADFFVITETNKELLSFESIVKKLSLPLFIKPANLGSSVGISRADDEKEYKDALDMAFMYDVKVIVEEYIKGREIECAVLGNENPAASVPGEIIPKDGFYSYEAKYIDEEGAVLKIPADLSPDIADKVRHTAVQSFQALSCSGMGRVDMFLTDGNVIFVNEINTIPGFTKISMYPKLWEYSGIGFTELVDRLISLAMEDFVKRSRLKTTVNE